MLPKKNRLSLRKNPFLFKTDTRRFYSPTLSVLWNTKIPKDDPSPKNSRFAVLVGKKVSIKAVIRNKIKRQIHQTIQETLINIKPSINILIIAKPNILKLSARELKEEIIKTIQKTI